MVDLILLWALRLFCLAYPWIMIYLVWKKWLPNLADRPRWVKAVVLITAPGLYMVPIFNTLDWCFKKLFGKFHQGRSIRVGEIHLAIVLHTLLIWATYLVSVSALVHQTIN